jgi:hypothetical protein
MSLLLGRKERLVGGRVVVVLEEWIGGLEI